MNDGSRLSAMTSPAKTVREVLIAARWILEHHEWTQRVFHRVDDGKHCFCLGGAVNATLVADTDENGRALRSRAKQHLEHALRDENPVWISYLYTRYTAWNDAPGRTKAEVLALLDRTIARCP